MKKWIILIALVALLVGGILIAEKLAQPAGGGNIKLPQEETTTQATYSAEDLALMELTFEEYQAMTGEEQQEFKNSFSALQVFIDWYWDAKEIFDAVKADGCQTWLGAGVRLEEHVKMGCERGADLFTSNEPAKLMEILKRLGWREGEWHL